MRQNEQRTDRLLLSADGAEAAAYELTLDKEMRKLGGVYYTPAHIISYILDQTLEQADITANPFVRVLDPACGCGHFLVAAFDVLLRKLAAGLAALRQERAAETYLLEVNGQRICLSGAEYWQEENLPRHILSFCLFGADRDAEALALAQRRLAAKCPDQEVTANLLLCDSLTKWEEEQLGQAAAFWDRRFDYIIGNPPYIPVTRMNKEQKAYYRTHYECAEGRLNTFALFLERAIEKASVKVGMIVPSRLLLNTQYQKIRHYILNRTRLETVFEAQEGVFGSAVVDTVVLILAIDKPAAVSLPPVKIECCSQTGRIVKEVEAGSFIDSPRVFISFAAGRQETAAIRALENQSVPLGSIACIRDGIIQGAVGPELFLGRNPRDDARCQPVLFGHSITAYSCRWQGEYIWYDPAGLTQLENSRTQGSGRGLRLRTPAVFDHPKIVSRQTADHIIAAMDITSYYYMNTLHGTTVTDPDYDPWYVLAVMNSGLIHCWYAWRFAETGRSFAQVKIANLNTLPIPVVEPAVRLELARLARQASEPAQQGQDMLLYKNTIDELLYRHCRFDEECIRMMRDFTEQISQRACRRLRR